VISLLEKSLSLHKKKSLRELEVENFSTPCVRIDVRQIDSYINPDRERKVKVQCYATQMNSRNKLSVR